MSDSKASKVLTRFDESPAATLLIAIWFAGMGAALLWGCVSLVLGAFCFFACGVNAHRWLRCKAQRP